MDWRVLILRENLAKHKYDLEKKNIKLIGLEDTLKTYIMSSDLIETNYHTTRLNIWIDICRSDIAQLNNEIEYLNYKIDKMNAEGVCNSMM